MKCPSCQTVGKSEALNPRIYEGVEIDECSQCKGSWLDEGELIKILETKEEEFSEGIVKEAIASAFSGIPVLEQKTRELCPKCSEPMRAVNYSYSSGIVIDRCPNSHGVWLNHGELEKLQAHYKYWDEESRKKADDWKKFVQSVKTKGAQKPDMNLESGSIRYMVSAIFRKYRGTR